jgi:hypothetical protein
MSVEKARELLIILMMNSIDGTVKVSDLDEVLTLLKEREDKYD